MVESSVMPTYSRLKIEFTHGQGPWLWDVTGRKYLDFGSGIAVNTLGHADRRLIKALTDQAEKLWHISNIYQIPGQERLAKSLCDQSFADCVFFTNSGAEAVECAIKTVRKYHSHHGSKRFHIIGFEGAFHGRTLATIAAAGQKKMTDGFGPMPVGFSQVPWRDWGALELAITDETAAILVEPVQGEGGIKVLLDEDLKYLRALCDRHGILLVFDEVQCGFGRTGKLFFHEWSGITPDIMTVAKGIGGGFPLGACLATEAAAVGMVTGTHGSTYGGNPLAMAMGLAILDIVLADGFLEHVLLMGHRFYQSMGELINKYPDILQECRGQGLLLGIKCKIPNTDLLIEARAQGLLLVGAGDNVLRVFPPLNVEPDALNEGLIRLDAACASLRNKYKVA